MSDKDDTACDSVEEASVKNTHHVSETSAGVMKTSGRLFRIPPSIKRAPPGSFTGVKTNGNAIEARIAKRIIVLGVAFVLNSRMRDVWVSVAKQRKCMGHFLWSSSNVISGGKPF
jgi:hypothetical protein